MKDMWKLETGLKKASMSMPRVTESEDIWGPLHAVVPSQQRDGFMYMGKYKYMYVNPYNQKVTVETYDYKHGITRKYLHISKSGRTFCNTGKSINGNILLEPCSKQTALDVVFKNIREFGVTPETKYDEQYRMERNKKLAELGFVTFDVSPGKIKKTSKEFSFEEEF